MYNEVNNLIGFKYNNKVYYYIKDENMVNQIYFLSLVLENEEIKKVIDKKYLEIIENNNEKIGKIE